MSQRADDARTLTEHEAHLAKIQQIVKDWQAGRISVIAKRGQIADLNAQYYGKPVRGDAGFDITTSPRLADDIVANLADRAMIPVEAAAAAIAAQRDAGVRASVADDLEEARRILTEGRQAYAEILRASR